jgi:hypothetical protein
MWMMYKMSISLAQVTFLVKYLLKFGTWYKPESQAALEIYCISAGIKKPRIVGIFVLLNSEKINSNEFIIFPLVELQSQASCNLIL